MQVRMQVDSGRITSDRHINALADVWTKADTLNFYKYFALNKEWKYEFWVFRAAPDSPFL